MKATAQVISKAMAILGMLSRCKLALRLVRPWQAVQMIWSVFERAEMDLFTSVDNFLCPIYFSKQRDALAHN